MVTNVLNKHEHEKPEMDSSSRMHIEESMANGFQRESICARWDIEKLRKARPGVEMM
jgi:hypothetical protein